MVRASFFGLEIGKSALVVSQLGLDVTGHNIANVDTKGYTRQRIINTAYDPFSTIGRALPVSQARVGGGVKVLIHDQIRSAYLDSRYRVQNTLNSYWQKRTENLSYLESYFDNINEKTSINYNIASFFEAIKVLAEDTVEKAPRKLLQTAGLDLVKQLNTIYAGLIDLQESENLAVKTTIEEINRMARDISELNTAIYGFEVTGHMALDLRDKRNLLLDDLSSIIPIEYREYSDGRGNSLLEVRIGGEILVDHDKYYELDVRETANVIPGEDPVWEAYWKTKQVADPDADFTFFIGRQSKKLTIETDAPYIVANLSRPADLSDPADAAAVAKLINGLAIDFSKLHVQWEGVWGPNPDDPGGPDILIGGTMIADAAKPGDLATAQQILDDLRDILGDVTLAVDCDQGGTHAFLTLEGYMFARSAGCIDSGKSVNRVQYYGETMDHEPGALLVTGGELLAYLEMRDSYDVHTPGIPYYIELLNNLSRALLQEINEIHREGYTEEIDRPADLMYSDGVTVIGNGSFNGVDFFWIDFDATMSSIAATINGLIDEILNDDTLPPGPPDYTIDKNDKDPYYQKAFLSLYKVDDFVDLINTMLINGTDSIDPADPTDYATLNALMRDPENFLNLVTAKNLTLSDAVMDSEYNIACSTVEIDKNIPGGLQRGNNENMNLLYELFLKKNITILDGGVDIGSFDGYATGIRFDVANTLSFSRKTADNFNVLTIAAENQRLAISGVSLDEEMTNLIKYQHAYNGAARVITAMDEALDVLINRTGRVGL